MDKLRICVIGGGSTYTPELIEGFIEEEKALPIEKIALMDINPQRLEIVGGLAGRMLKAAGSEIELQLSTDRREALEGANFVITQIRVGGMQARIRDERIPPEVRGSGPGDNGARRVCQGPAHHSRHAGHRR